MQIIIFASSTDKFIDRVACPSFIDVIDHACLHFNRNLIKLMDDFNESADKLVLLLDRESDTGRSVPLMEGLGKTTLDVIAKVSQMYR